MLLHLSMFLLYCATFAFHIEVSLSLLYRGIYFFVILSERSERNISILDCVRDFIFEILRFLSKAQDDKCGFWRYFGESLKYDNVLVVIARF